MLQIRLLLILLALGIGQQLSTQVELSTNLSDYWEEDLSSYSPLEHVSSLGHQRVRYKIPCPDIPKPFLTLSLEMVSGADFSSRKIPSFEIIIDDKKTNYSWNSHLGNSNTLISDLIILSPGTQWVEIIIPNSNQTKDKINLHWYYPGVTDQSTPLTKREASPVDTFCHCLQSEIKTREAWCPQNNCPENSFPSPNTPMHMIVHHSAGTNNASDWAAVVRSIWHQHAIINNWADIGYHYLIDPNGIIYSGRSPQERGAHFCQTNGNTLGICILGDFNSTLPMEEALLNTAQLIARYSCSQVFDPLEGSYHLDSDQFLPHISGHRDGCVTDCPGNEFYLTIGDLRHQVAYYTDYLCGENLPTPILNSAVIDGEESFLNWEYPLKEKDFLGFEISQREGTFMDYQIKDTVGRNRTTWTGTASDSTVVYYRIRAFSSEKESLWSNAIQAEVLTAISNQINGSTQVKVYPNPANHTLNVRLKHFSPIKMNNYQIKDISGKIIRREKISGLNSGDYFHFDVDLSHLQSGTYYLNIEELDGLEAIPFIVQ